MEGKKSGNMDAAKYGCATALVVLCANKNKAVTSHKLLVSNCPTMKNKSSKQVSQNDIYLL